MQPMPAERQPSAAHASVSGAFRHFAAVEAWDSRRLCQHRLRLRQAADIKIFAQRSRQRRQEIIDSSLPDVLTYMGLQVCPTSLATDRIPVGRAFDPNNSLDFEKQLHDRRVSAALKEVGRNLQAKMKIKFSDDFTA